MFTSQIMDSNQTFVCTEISSGVLSEIHSRIWPVNSVPDTQMPKLQKPAVFLISIGCLVSVHSCRVWKITMLHFELIIINFQREKMFFWLKHIT